MVIVVVLLVVLAVGLAVGAATLDERRRRALAETRVADQRTTTVRAELAVIRDDLARREVELLDARAAAETLRQQLRTEQQHAGALQMELEVRQLEIERVSADLRKATSGHDAASLWQLEMMRSERTWRYHVAPGLDSPSPLDQPGSDQLRTAVDIEASALREESGTAVEVEWNIPRPLDPGPALVVLRQVQEHLAQFAKRSDRITVRVSDGGDHVKTEVIATADPEVAGLEPVVLRIPYVQ